MNLNLEIVREVSDMGNDMRLIFFTADLRRRIDELADHLEISKNQLVNMILLSYFDTKEKNRLSLMREIADLKKAR